jgi:signal transduction histidine kinase
MAHEFNNLLTAVLGSLERLSREQTEERHLHWVQNAMAAARRGAVLTQQLLSYARKQFMAPAPTDVPAAIGGMTELIRGSLGGRISLDVDFAPDTWLVLTDSAQLELALLNLVINARQAMPQGGTLRLTSVNIPRGSLILPLDLQPGDYVCLSVSDTGTGMTPEVLGRAMEPFFTTKGIGGGSGLGLSQAYGVICQLGGTLRLNSTPGNGTKADLFLPRITDPAASVTRAPLPPGAGRAG